MFKDKLEEFAWYLIKRAKENYSVGMYEPRARVFTVIGGSNIEVDSVDSYVRIYPELLLENAKNER